MCLINFDRFISYDFGNVKYYVYNTNEKFIKILSQFLFIYCTKYLAKNEEYIPRKYLKLLDRQKKIKFHFSILYKNMQPEKTENFIHFYHFKDFDCYNLFYNYP
jgi:hypothetical protein